MLNHFIKDQDRSHFLTALLRDFCPIIIQFIYEKLGSAKYLMESEFGERQDSAFIFSKKMSRVKSSNYPDFVIA